MTVETWIEQEYFESIYPDLDKEKIVIRSVFDEDVKEQIKWHFKQIAKLKTDGIEKKGKSNQTD